MTENQKKLITSIINLEKQKYELILQLIPEIYKKNEIKLDEKLFILIDEAVNFDGKYLSVRACNCLRAMGFIYLGDIVCNPNMKIGFTLLKTIPNFGKKAFVETMSVLSTYKFERPIINSDYWIKRREIQPFNFDSYYNPD